MNFSGRFRHLSLSRTRRKGAYWNGFGSWDNPLGAGRMNLVYRWQRLEGVDDGAPELGYNDPTGVYH